MVRYAALVRPLALGALLVAAAGCASTTSGPRIGYASWNHFVFSLRANWHAFVGWSPVGTTGDEAAAQREGGWWGDEVPVLPER
jgi:hypothetical protein